MRMNRTSLLSVLTAVACIAVIAGAWQAQRLAATGASYRVCASNIPEHLAVGDPWRPDTSAELPEGVDSFGERGEFHTEVCLPGSSPTVAGAAR